MARARTTSVDCTTSCRRGGSSQGAPASRTAGLGHTTRRGQGAHRLLLPHGPSLSGGHRAVRNPQRERATGSRHPLCSAPSGNLIPWASLSQSQARIPVSQMRILQF